MRCLITIMVFFYSPILFAQELWIVQRTAAPILLDGYVDELLWQSIRPFPLTMYTPVYKGELTEQSVIRMCYDDEYIYVSGIFFDSDPDGIMGTSLLRDGNPGGDFFNVLFDTYNDNENFNTFSTMPSGNRLDAEITNDAEGDRIFNQSWNTFWDVRTSQDEHGWYAEMRIPFSSLRFEDDNGKVIFGLIVHRLIGRKNERQTFPAIPPNWDTGAWKPSQAGKIQFVGINRKNSVYLTPYVLGGVNHTNEYNSVENRTSSTTIYSKETGLDVKMGLSSNATLDITINTDFAQVEADNVQLNLSRFSLFFPEKRQFFQERSGVFDFTTSTVSKNRLFHSRKIGLDDDGNLLSVYGGSRFVGRFKNLDVGILNMHTEGVDASSWQNFGVVRLRQRVINTYSYVGALFTSRIGSDGDYNTVIGADAIFRVSGPYYFTAKGGQVFSNGFPKSNNSLLFLKWEKRANARLGYFIEAERTGQNFLPGIGFILRNDNLTISQNIVYGKFINGKIIRKYQPFLSNSIFLRNDDNSLETLWTQPGLSISFTSGSNISFSVLRVYDAVTSSFDLSGDVQILTNNYTFHSLQGSYTMVEGRKIRFNASSEIGEYYDGNKTTFTLSPIWNPSKHFEIKLNYTFTSINFQERHEKLRADIASAAILTALNTQWSLRSLMQYSHIIEQMVVNAGVRYNRKEGNDLYLVFNQVTITGNSSTENTARAGTETWNLILKYTYTFIK